MTDYERRSFPGAKSVHDFPVVQDGPPRGGFPAIRYGRKLPSTGPTGFTTFALVGALIAYGYYKVGLGRAERRRYKEEKYSARMALVPVLQAEEDRRYLRAKARAIEFEKELMKDMKGWIVNEPVYKTRWMPARTPPPFVEP